jgi:hypothetical protein
LQKETAQSSNLQKEAAIDDWHRRTLVTIGALKSSWLGAEDLEAILLRVHAISEKLSHCLLKT